MRVALVNPPWSFDGSIYFGCRHEHLPLELGYAGALLERAGHEARIFDGALDGLDMDGIVAAVADYGPEMTVVTTAPTYLFWRCAQPELRVPRAFLDALGDRGGRTVAVGPHGSATPGAALAKLGCDMAIRGECEEAVVELANGQRPREVPGLAWRYGREVVVNGPTRAATFSDLPALRWPDPWVRRHRHHHHRFETEPQGPGAEVEASRGCPYNCSFCAKIDFRDKYRRRDLGELAAEIDGLVAQGVGYLYFVDEIFLPWKELLELLAARPVRFGIQTRIDLWKPEMIRLLGGAGCVSVEAGVESLTEQGRDALDKKCRMSTDELTERLIMTRRHVPFVQANLIEVAGDDPDEIERWRGRMNEAGIWANDPVPLYPYPSSPDYRKLWGAPDDQAWERAHRHYLAQFDKFSDIQDARPLPLEELEAGAAR
jgi:B12-binding domain/radical SAM domain protein of rhizo-twelve system